MHIKHLSGSDPDAQDTEATRVVQSHRPPDIRQSANSKLSPPKSPLPQSCTMPGHIVNPAAQPASPSGQSNAPDKTGAFNGALSHNRGLSSSQSSPLANMRKSYRTNGRITSSSSVEESTLTIQRRSNKELGATISDKVYSTDYITLVEWIHNERLLSLPKEGSGWDKVLMSLVVMNSACSLSPRCSFGLRHSLIASTASVWPSRASPEAATWALS